MSRIATATALALVLAACVADGGDQSLLILRNAPPTGDCEPTTGGDRFVARGIIDANATTGYIFTPVVENVIEDVAGARRKVYVTGANVDLRFLPGVFSDAELAALEEQGLTSFSQSFSASADPGGVLGLGFEVVPWLVLQELAGKLGPGERTQVTADVSVIGDLNGRQIESNVFSYPIDVCNGCLTTNLGPCADLPQGFTGEDGGVCQQLQDGLLECCTSGEVLVCPATSDAPPA